MHLSNCACCGISNIGGIGHTILVLVDGKWYCEDCLPKKKGRVKCQKCGKEPFQSDDHFKTVNGRYMCTECMEKSGIIRKYDYVMQALADATRHATVSQASAATSNAASSLGGLKILLDQNLSPGETVSLSIQGNAGEAIACTRSNVFILKSGLAVGSITGRKCSRYPWSDVKAVQMKVGNLYGILEVESDCLPPNDPNDITRAKKSDNAITFLLSRKGEFDHAVSSMKSFLHR